MKWYCWAPRTIVLYLWKQTIGMFQCGHFADVRETNGLLCRAEYFIHPWKLDWKAPADTNTMLACFYKWVIVVSVHRNRKDFFVLFFLTFFLSFFFLVSMQMQLNLWSFPMINAGGYKSQWTWIKLLQPMVSVARLSAEASQRAAQKD